MKFPYGLSDFATLIQEGYFYQDRTDRIPVLEEAGRQLLFIRPRRFGKSLLLSMLEQYYDVNRADQFEALFGGLAIGRNPTPLRNRYFVMKWDFSLVKAQGDVKDIEAALHQHLNDCIREFALRYQERLAHRIELYPDNALSSWRSALMAVSQTPHKLYLLIDEYDDFANEVLMTGRKLYVERLQDLWLPAYEDKTRVPQLRKHVCQTGDLAPLVEFIEQRYFPVLSNRDYRWSNELLVKIAFLTLLFDDRLYMMVSETEVDHGYIDLSLIVRPDLRRFQALDLLLEFKYVGLKELGLTGEQMRERPHAELAALPVVAARLAEADEQARRYGAALRDRYGLTDLRLFAVVGIGLEQVVWRRCA